LPEFDRNSPDLFQLRLFNFRLKSKQRFGHAVADGGIRAGDLRDEGRSGVGLVLPVGRQDSLSLVVPGQPVDPGLDENEPELGVLVLAVALQVLADANGLLDLEVHNE